MPTKQKAKAKRNPYKIGHIKIPRLNKRAFDKLTKPQQRVAIAKDVLLRLEAGKIKPMKGAYMLPTSSDVRRKIYDSTVTDWGKVMNQNAQTFVEENRCSACAKGSIMLSWAAQFNKVPLSHIWNSGNKEKIRELDAIFPKGMWDAMEEAFESSLWSLKRVMENLITNKGSFKYQRLTYSDTENTGEYDDDIQW